MLAIFSVIRLGCRQVLHYKQLEKVLVTPRYFGSQSDDSDSSDDEDNKKTPKNTSVKNEETLKKLNLLINSMIEKEFSTPPPQSVVDLKLAQPKKKRKKQETKTQVQEINTETEKFDESLANAARDVAGTLGGDVKQTEKELLQKLLYRTENNESAEQDDTSPSPKPAVNLSELIAGMKIEQGSKETGPPGEGRAQQVRRVLSRHGGTPQHPDRRQHRDRRELPRHKLATGRVNLFDSPPLGIFKPSDKSQVQEDNVPVLETWQRLQERELKLTVTHPPSNIYEEMIQWTDQGKLWKFPINNEQGLEEEAKVFFADHVFLERHLEPWCPTRGPIRHFMELVCVGLSKNPYITVKDKQEHLEWYRSYFEDKKALLAEVGAITDNVPPRQDSAQ